MDEWTQVRQRYATDYRQPSVDAWQGHIYHPRHPVGMLLRHENERQMAWLLNREDLELRDARILDVGCGYGNYLSWLSLWGVQPSNLFGLEPDPHRARFVAERLKGVRVVIGSAASLPFADGRFDMCIVSTLFSSFHSAANHRTMADEIGRVLADNGYVFWNDLARGAKISLSLPNVAALFPDFRVVSHRRCHHGGVYRWAKRSTLVSQCLLLLPFFRKTHLVILLQK